ncbi:hypothetical protein [Halovivax gelatinilyticus]|uniref:hypothetical protein n=1 Tax=Halovivax gelatinilyticus TaxID=2961597 RepID=UPI0020CA5E1C|nr:hypothetical protein [Halovivax gelatinilyticus]
MSVDADRDFSAESKSIEAGLQGFPVDAVCTGCQREHVKRVRPEDVNQEFGVDPLTLDVADLTSFKHVCHRCGTATWWNPTDLLKGLIETERDRGE